MIFESYTRMHRYHTRKAGLLAVGIYMASMLLYYVVGLALRHQGLRLFIPASLLITAGVVILALLKSGGLKSIGLGTKDAGKSALLGLITGGVFFFSGRIVLGATLFERGIGGVTLTRFMGDPRFTHVPEATLGSWLPGALLFVGISVITQEVLVRGYLGTRITGLIRNEWLAVIVTAFIFALLFIPMQAPMLMRSLGWVFLSYVPMQLVWLFVLHVWLQFLYRSFNSLAAPIIFHMFFSFHSNLSLGIFYALGA